MLLLLLIGGSAWLLRFLTCAWLVRRCSLDTTAGIGAGSDSFYEYLLKPYLLFGESDYYVKFVNVRQSDLVGWAMALSFIFLTLSHLTTAMQTYDSVMRYMKGDHWYFGVDYSSGAQRNNHIDSLSAFWPGIQVLVGDLSNAVESHRRYFALWKRYSWLCLPQ